MSAPRLVEELAAKPAALNRLADGLARRDPYAALPSLVDDEPANVLLLGTAAARYACEAAASRLRTVGLGATAEYASAGTSVPPGPDTLVVAVAVGGGQRELCTSLDRYAEQTAIIVLAEDAEAPVARYADVLVPLHAGEEHSGLRCRGYQHALALLLLLAHRLGAPASDASPDLGVTLRRAANATADLLERTPLWLPDAAAVLGTDGVHLVAPAERMSSARQAALAVRQGPVLPAHAVETGEWSYTDRYLAAIEDYRALLFTGSHYDARFAAQLGELQGTFVAVGAEVEGAAAAVRYIGDSDPDVALLTEPVIAELLAAQWWGELAAD